MSLEQEVELIRQFPIFSKIQVAMQKLLCFSSERLTCLVLTPDGTATLVVPELEAPRAAAATPDLARATWTETADPYALVASLERIDLAELATLYARRDQKSVVPTADRIAPLPRSTDSAKNMA